MTSTYNSETSGSVKDSFNTLLNGSTQESSGIHHHHSFLESWEFIIIVVVVVAVILSFIIAILCILADKIVKYFQRKKTRSEIIAHFQKYWKVEVCRNCWCRPATVRCDSCRARYFCTNCSDAVHNHRRDKRCCSSWRTSLSKHVTVSIRKHGSTDHEGGGANAPGGAPGNQSVAGTPRRGHRKSVNKGIGFRALEEGAGAAAEADNTNGAPSSSQGNTITEALLLPSSQQTPPLSSSPLSAGSVAAAAAKDGEMNINGDGGYFAAAAAGIKPRNLGITMNGEGDRIYMNDYDDDEDDDDDDDVEVNASINGAGEDASQLLRALNSSATSYTTFRTLLDEDGYDSS